MADTLRIETLTGSDPALARRVPDLADLRITVFREFPYLYDGTHTYEEKYLATYTRCADSVAILVFDGDRVVGASTGLPLAAETEEFQQPFARFGFNPATIFYCGESVLLRDYRGRGVYKEFFAGRERHARKLGGFSTMALCGVVRAHDHPRRPPDYQPLDAVWQKFGYTKHPELVTHYTWRDLDEAQESPKEMVFWLKTL